MFHCLATLNHLLFQEYGFDEFDIQVDALKEGDKVVIVDDLLATG